MHTREVQHAVLMRDEIPEPGGRAKPIVSCSARNKFSVTTSRAVRSARNAADVSGTTSRMRATASRMAATFRANTAASTTGPQDSPHERRLERAIVEVIQHRPDATLDHR